MVLIISYNCIQGDWKGQIHHIYAHLMGIAEEDRNFRSSIGEPEMGEVLS